MLLSKGLLFLFCVRFSELLETHFALFKCSRNFQKSFTECISNKATYSYFKATQKRPTTFRYIIYSKLASKKNQTTPSIT